jgi:hypothetical protein
VEQERRAAHVPLDEPLDDDRLGFGDAGEVVRRVRAEEPLAAGARVRLDDHREADPQGGGARLEGADRDLGIRERQPGARDRPREGRLRTEHLRRGARGVPAPRQRGAVRDRGPEDVVVAEDHPVEGLFRKDALQRVEGARHVARRASDLRDVPRARDEAARVAEDGDAGACLGEDPRQARHAEPRRRRREQDPGGHGGGTLPHAPPQPPSLPGPASLCDD